MMILKPITTLLNPARADEVAGELNENEEEGWSYRVQHDPKGTGSSFVKIFDDEGFYVGNL